MRVLIDENRPRKLAGHGCWERREIYRRGAECAENTRRTQAQRRGLGRRPIRFEGALVDEDFAEVQVGVRDCLGW
jgi:hypothetical protein